MQRVRKCVDEKFGREWLARGVVLAALEQRNDVSPASKLGSRDEPQGAATKPWHRQFGVEGAHWVGHGKAQDKNTSGRGWGCLRCTRQ